jgi:3'(2'), 5'-bisphosphate nucleotidase
VTEADRQGEKLILARLAEHFPDIPVVSEEDACECGTPDAIGPRFFLVDPVDGTKAFVRGDPHFTVNIGLIDGGRPVAGAVTCPPSGETWFTAGGKAWKRKARGARDPCAWPTPGAALALVSHTMSEAQTAELARQYGFDLREPMDSSIKFCRIAEGGGRRLSAPGTDLEWDVAAGHAVLAAAGGSVLTPEGEAFAYGKTADGFRNGWFVARGG